MKFDLKNSFLLALPVTLAVWLVSFLFGLAKIGTTPLFSSIPSTSVLTGTIGSKVMGYVSGILPQINSINSLFSVTTLYVLLSSWAIILAGSFLFGQFNLPQIIKGNVGRLTSIIIYGAVPFYLILVGFTVKGIGFMTILGLLIHTFAVAWLAGWVGDRFKISV